MMKKTSLGDVFLAHNERSAGFDYLRLGLALAVIFWHTSVTVYGHEFDKWLQGQPLGAISRLVLPMFFTLSGFLVASSLVRTSSLVAFATHRVVRIFPALVTEVTLSALLLGPILTVVSLHEYFFLRHSSGI